MDRLPTSDRCGELKAFSAHSPQAIAATPTHSSDWFPQGPGPERRKTQCSAISRQGAAPKTQRGNAKPASAGGAG